MAQRPLSIIEKNALLNFDGFVGAVEQTARAKSAFFLSIDLDVATLPGYIASRKELSKIRDYSYQIRDGQYSAEDLAKRFLGKHNANIDDASTAVDVLTTYMATHNTAGQVVASDASQFDYFIDAMFREAILKLEA